METTIKTPLPQVPQDIHRHYGQLNEGSALERVKAVDDLCVVARTYQRMLAKHARDHEDATWQDIATVLDISKQAAHERLGG
jgi:hypothetical protein